MLKGINELVKRMPDNDVQSVEGLKAKTLMQRISADLKVSVVVSVGECTHES